MVGVGLWMTGAIPPMTGGVAQMVGAFPPMAGEVTPVTGEVAPVIGASAPEAGGFAPMAGGFAPVTCGFAPAAGAHRWNTGEFVRVVHCVAQNGRGRRRKRGGKFHRSWNDPSPVRRGG